jgi:hypothetical protein
MRPLSSVQSATGRGQNEVQGKKEGKGDELSLQLHHAALPEAAKVEVVVELFLQLLEEGVVVVRVVFALLRLVDR